MPKDKYGVNMEVLTKLHLEQKMTPQQIAGELGCQRSTVYYYLKKYEVDKLPKYERLEGQRFGRLVAKTFMGIKNRSAEWECLCDCGNITIVTTSSLKYGKVKSCGCLARDKNTTHGMAGTRPYHIWQGMKSRCENPNQPHYERYGGRGIAYCPEWELFENFWNDMKEGYADNLTLERIDNYKGYSKENCRWSTAKEQNFNKRNNVVITYNNKTLTLTEWANELGINRRRLYELHERYKNDEKYG